MLGVLYLRMRLLEGVEEVKGGLVFGGFVGFVRKVLKGYFVM